MKDLRAGGMKVATNWEADKRWSDIFLPEIKMILGLHLIGEPQLEEDCERNTDLIVLRMEAVRIACRVRHYEYFQKYPNDITIRSGRPSGAKTELTKIVEGWGNYFFYGFSDEQEQRLAAWRLCDLNAFRIYFNRYIVAHKGLIPGTGKANNDGSSDFRAFNAVDIPSFVLASHGFNNSMGVAA